MDLPHELRVALERLLDGVRPSELTRIAEAQSETYRHRADRGLDRPVVDSEQSAVAYAAWRLPATFAATATALGELARLAPDLAPRSHLDLGSGPGTALHAADSVFGAIPRRIALEGAEPFRALAARLEAEAGGEPDRTTWLAGNLTRPSSLEQTGPGFDLVTLAYVTGELAERARGPLLDRAWALTREAFVLVEPGTTAGYKRVMAARRRLIEHGASILAPCPHAAPCPLEPGDWCHFSVRVARSRLHRTVKGADLGFEDEKFAYLVATRRPFAQAPGRILRRPEIGRAEALLTVCTAVGTRVEQRVPRREKPRYRLAKKLRWGDAVPHGGGGEGS